MALKPIAWMLVTCALLSGAPARAGADEESEGTAEFARMFQRGRLELAAGGGYGVYNGRSYGIVALGGGYYLRDGLSAGLTGEAWLGSAPQVYDASPQVRYVFLDSSWRDKPYAGIFYRRTGYSRLWPPLNSAGARAGLVFPVSDRAYLTGGLAYEHDFDCSTAVYSSCDSVYPEVGLEFSF